MSIFSSDIIENELGYDPDPDKNMHLQIEREFNRLLDNYTPAQPIQFQLLKFLEYGMSDFMEYLQMNTWKHKNFPVLPEWWQGDFLYISNYGVSIIQLANGRSGVQISWKYTGSLEYRCIDLCINIAEFMEKYKNWCI